MTLLRFIILIFVNVSLLLSQEQKILFFEDFEDGNFASRGWYDHLKGKITTEEHIIGSKSSLEIKFLQGAKTPEGGTPGRHLFEETDEICLSYYVKYSRDYIGSGRSYHPHEFHFITNKDGKWVGPAFTNLTTYIEHNDGYPLLGIQDGENIDQSRIGQNLVRITENRGVAGCNGSSDGYPDDCYKSGDIYVNGKMWKAKNKYFSDEQGKYYKNDWHYIVAYFKLNSILDDIGINDGIIRYWFDGELIIDYTDILIRTGKHSDMKFNQFLIAPYIGDGSPVEQTMWIDNLTVSTKPIFTSIKENYASNYNLISANPTSEFIETSLEGNSVYNTNNNSLLAKIYNNLGECVISEAIQPMASILRFNVGKLAKGVYFLKIGSYYVKFMILR